jgi:uncharacterized membrane protein YphA (DoxX/SURF4 family)
MSDASEATWKSAAALAGRIVLAAVFAMGAFFKFADIGMTAGYIASVGFPFSTFLAWVAAIFETLLVIAFLSGLYFSEAALLAALYIVFLAFAFHMTGWDMASELGQMRFGAFVSHFPFAAGLLFAAAHGPGQWALRGAAAPRTSG